MTKIDAFDLYLLDLDGLLVNSEKLHFCAYQVMCKGRGFHLPWSFDQYCQIAHKSHEALEKNIFLTFPDLNEKWDILYSEKKRALEDLLIVEPVEMMPGAKEFLLWLKESEKKRCIVTHSDKEQVDIIREKQECLNTVEHWFTRQDYTKPKPDPEGYQKAIDVLAKEGDKIIGFEDSIKGLKALVQTPAQPVLITQTPFPEIPEYISKGVWHFKSLRSLCKI